MKLSISLNICLALDKINKCIIGTILFEFVVDITVDSGMQSWFVENVALV